MLKNVFLGDWDSIEDVIRDFSITKADVEDYTVIVAGYSYEDYSGDAFVLLERDGKYFEASGGHCSCYGLEGQWDLEESAELALKYRVDNGTSYGMFGQSIPTLKQHFGW